MKLISGGQTGVDRAALDSAIARGLRYGGWCPKGGLAEDFPKPPGLLAPYPRLKETPLADPAQRTEWNVRDAQACMIIVAASGIAASPGTALAQELAHRYRRPLLIANLDSADARERAALWLRFQQKRHGNALELAVGGPRESESPGIYARARHFLDALLQ